jgi:hypothetical protein
MTHSAVQAAALAERMMALEASLASSNLQFKDHGLGAPGGWFLGPKAENKQILMKLIVEAIEAHCNYRTSYHPEDPVVITEEVKASPDYEQAIAELRSGAAHLNSALQRSAPVFSMRSHGHMLWDQVLPGIVGLHRYAIQSEQRGR